MKLRMSMILAPGWIDILTWNVAESPAITAPFIKSGVTYCSEWEKKDVKKVRVTYI